MMASNDQSIVVLLGWLGCEDRYLNAYRRLYDERGIQHVTYIATPVMIMETSFGSLPLQAPSGWLSGSAAVNCNGIDSGDLSVHGLAWNILGDLHHWQQQKRPGAKFMFHVFSNGGCFVWEQILRILEWDKPESMMSEDSDPQHKFANVLSKLKNRMGGIVFDSCPAWFDGPSAGPQNALDQCSWEDQRRVLQTFGVELVCLQETDHMQQIRKRRCQEFFGLLQDAKLDIPQLYLFSYDDPLSDAKRVERIIQYQRSVRRQRSPVYHFSWRNSTHCAHLKRHPDDYRKAVDKYLAAVLLVQSKL